MNSRTAGLVAVLTLAVAGSGCTGGGGGGAGGGGGDGTTGRVSGKISVFQGSSAAAPPLSLAGVLAHRKPAPVRIPEELLCRDDQGLSTSSRPAAVTEWIPGAIIVRLDETATAAQALRKLQLPGVRIKHGGFASEYLHLLRVSELSGAPLTLGRTIELAAQLKKLPGVRFTEVDQWQHAFAVPNDKLYAAQWHYTALNLPAAWDVTTGSAAIVVADIDTGIVPHPDLDPRVILGIDMISDPTNAGDGDGRDDNPLDMGGDGPNGGSTWHGSHTAGTIGAATNNDYGVAGVDWKAKLLPVRVLGVKGGDIFDIAAGMTWATGGAVPGSRQNTTPAVVVNMSLGGTSDASPTYQDAIDQGNNRGAVFVIAAGNSNEDAQRTIPCIQQGVICVGATRFSGTRASYSNFGAAVTVMAPGGEVSEDANGDTYPDGVLSTYRDKDNMPIFYFNQGTSMATPHVTGIVALMKSVNGTVTSAQAKQFLVTTASAASKCNEGCGAGMVNAQAAVLAAKGTPPTGPAKLSCGTTELQFSRLAPTVTLGISNLGAQPLTVNATLTGADAAALSFPKGAGLTLAAGQSGGLDVTANLTGLTDGTHVAEVDLTSNGGNLNVNVKIKVGGATGKPASVGLAYQNGAGAWKVAGEASATPESGYAYSIDAPPGKYYVVGLIDENGNNMFEDAEPFGFYPTNDSPKQVEVIAGQALTQIDFPVVPHKPVNDNSTTIGIACTNMCPNNGVCVTAWPGGYCSKNCATDACPLGSSCIDSGTAKFCLAICTGPGAGQSNCRSGYVCYDDGTGKGSCLPACTTNADCGTNGSCNLATGYCQ